MINRLFLFVSILLVVSCLDRLNVTIPDQYANDLIVDGVITDEPGPYTVKLSRAVNLDGLQVLGKGISAKQVTIIDNAGNSEVLEQKEVGTYQTKSNGIRGVIGREYHIRIEMLDGKVFESIPDKMNPAGELDSLYYEFESVQPANEPTTYGYRIYVDAKGMAEDDSYLRWKFSGTYIVETKPQYFTVPGCPPCGCPAPLACSGYAIVDGELHLGYVTDPKTGEVTFVKDLKCECCRCWVTQHEERPTVAGNQVVANGRFVKVEVGYVPVNFYTFFEKYRVEVKQMSLSKAAYNYWRSVRLQQEAAGSLFQPVTGKIQTNLFEVDKAERVQGVFYASSVKKKQMYLDKATVKVIIPEPVNCGGRLGAAGVSCLTFPSSTTLQPEDWN